MSQFIKDNHFPNSKTAFLSHGLAVSSLPVPLHMKSFTKLSSEGGTSVIAPLLKTPLWDGEAHGTKPGARTGCSRSQTPTYPRGVRSASSRPHCSLPKPATALPVARVSQCHVPEAGPPLSRLQLQCHLLVRKSHRRRGRILHPLLFAAAFYFLNLQCTQLGLRKRALRPPGRRGY